MSDFSALDLRPELMDAIHDAGYVSMRPVQEEGLPAALAGRDVLGLAPTGTGKTAAFVLPILQRLLETDGPGPRALVVTPTRELASQVHGEFEALAVHTDLRSAAIFGGVPYVKQERALAKKPEVLVACPGRLLDLWSQRVIDLSNIQVLVLDEADHMFDMGFLPDVRSILRALPQERQNLMFSATMPNAIRHLADDVLHEPHVVELAHSQPAETIDYALYPMAESQKIEALEKLVESPDFRSAIVFLRTKNRASGVAAQLISRGHSAVLMQGDLTQPQRERALQGFREGKYTVLVATDIAARGLDVIGVSHVVNFDAPNTPDAYTHRIGRTGRSEQTGSAFTFVAAADVVEVLAIEKRLGKSIERRTIEGLEPRENALPILDPEKGKASVIPDWMIAGGAPAAPEVEEVEEAAAPEPEPETTAAPSPEPEPEAPASDDQTPPGIPAWMIAKPE